MSRRTAASLLAMGLILALAGFGLTRPADYVTLRPGPTINVLGTYDGKQIIQVTGHKTYRDDGGLRMVTVYQSRPEQKLTLIDMLSGWVSPDVAVLPRDVVFKKDETDKQVEQQSAAQMTSSQDAAVAAALDALKIGFRSQVGIALAAVTKGGAAEGKLQVNDAIMAVDGRTAGTSDALVELIRRVKPGTPLDLTVQRGNATRHVTVTTAADPKNPSSSRIGVTLQPTPVYKFTFPFSVDIRLSDNIGGPSAGMMFALSIYDLLTPGSLTGGKMIAGSGTIDPDGTVGPIGGIGQKIAGAERDGAHLFLVAADNCEEATRAHYDADKIRLVKVTTLDDAIKDVDAWRQNPKADLPGCSR